ncbi:esterase-like activity of phytase family protein [Paracoccus aerius]
MRLTLALLACTAAAPALAQERFPATLAGHASLPAFSMVVPPADAPRDLWVSGKFTGKARNEVPMSVEGDVGPAYGGHKTGISLPFIGQPVQGMSGLAMNRDQDGSWFALTDNGFGSKANSPDAMLFFHRMQPDFATGRVARLETVFLRDPDRKVPFRIANEATDSRYLTGADFDPESIQAHGDEIWIGDEFGPFVLRVARDGRVLSVHQTMLDGTPLAGPDTPGTVVPAQAGVDFQAQRSGGYEGMALQPGTGLLWAMLEKPLLGADGQPEGRFLRVMTFDTAAGDWTGDSFRFRLSDGATAIGDFNFIDETRALVIERDNGEGNAALACAEGPPTKAPATRSPPASRTWCWSTPQTATTKASSAASAMSTCWTSPIPMERHPKGWRPMAGSPSPSSPSRTWPASMTPISWLPMTTTCPSRAGGRSARPRIASSSCCPCRNFWRHAEAGRRGTSRPRAPCGIFAPR